MEMIIGVICFLIYLKVGSLFPFEGELPLLTKIILLIFWLPLIIYLTIGINVKKTLKEFSLIKRGGYDFFRRNKDS